MRELHKLSDLTGYGLQAKDGEIGQLEEVYFDDRRWLVRYLIVRTGSWLVGQKVLLVPASIEAIDAQNSLIQVNLTRKQIEHAPPVNTEQPVSEHYQQQYYGYYGWEPYWTTDPLFVSTPAVPPFVHPELPKKPDNPHLRSSDEVAGYQIAAEDGNIGHVEDFILDDQTWAVRYLEIDTRNWLPGRHVLVSPSWVEQVDWGEQQVHVGLTRESIKSAPEYDSKQHVSRHYELELFKHYGKNFIE